MTTSTNVRTERLLKADAQIVWNLIAPVLEWQEWSHAFWFSKADLKTGGKALLWARVGLLRLPIPVRFQTIEPGRELRWYGGDKRLGYGSHYLRIEPVGEHQCRLVHGEDFTGPVVKLGWPVLGRFIDQPYKRLLRDVARQLET